ncbi:hypothetical protein NQZ68_018737, partial [Dissostichus eleginoides]
MISSFVLLSSFLDLHQVLLPDGVGPTEPRSAADGLSVISAAGGINSSFHCLHFPEHL